MEREYGVIYEYLSIISPINLSWTNENIRNENIYKDNLTIISENGLTDLKNQTFSILNNSKNAAQSGDSNDVNKSIFDIKHSDNIGRHFVNKRFIAAGEVVLVEPPFILAPIVQTPFSKCSSHCLNCLNEASSFTCKKCGFFFCSDICIDDNHKSECDKLVSLKLAQDQAHIHSLFQKNLLNQTDKFETEEEQLNAEKMIQLAVHSLYQPLRKNILKNYTLLAVLRTVLLMNQSSLAKQLVHSLQSQVDTDSKRYLANQARIVETLKNTIQVEESIEDLHKVCSVWDTNGFEVPIRTSARGQGIYIAASLLTHSCAPNCEQWFTNGSIVLRANQNIVAGSILTISYTKTLWPTRNRIDHLKMTKQFICNCSRCLDPKEFGTYLGSPLCKACKGKMLHTDPLSADADWKCEECQTTEPTKEVVRNDVLAIEILSKIDSESLLQALPNLTKEKFHPNYHLIVRMNKRIILEKCSIQNLSNDDVRLRRSVAEHLLEVMSKLFPRFSKQRALIAQHYLNYLSEEKIRFPESDFKHDLNDLSILLKDCQLVLEWEGEMQLQIQEIQESFDKLKL